MFSRIINAIKSRIDKKRVEDQVISTTIDDMKVSEKLEFDPKRVRAILEKCDLLEEVANHD